MWYAVPPGFINRSPKPISEPQNPFCSGSRFSIAKLVATRSVVGAGAPDGTDGEPELLQPARTTKPARTTASRFPIVRELLHR